MSSIEIKSQMTGSLWKLNIKEGEEVKKGQEVAILESMKMEIPIEADEGGTVKEIKFAEGDFIDEDDVVVVLE